MEPKFDNKKIQSERKFTLVQLWFGFNVNNVLCQFVIVMVKWNNSKVLWNGKKINQFTLKNSLKNLYLFEKWSLLYSTKYIDFFNKKMVLLKKGF